MPSQLEGRTNSPQKNPKKRTHEKTSSKHNNVKRHLANCSGHSETANLSPGNSIENSTPRDVRDAVCPLWSLPYEEQLSMKAEKVQDALNTLVRGVKKNCRRGRAEGGCAYLPKWTSTRKGESQHPVQLMGIVRSPVIDGYRNKSEFTVGLDTNGEPSVGFNVGLFRDGVTAVSSPSNCRHISPIAKCIATAFQLFLRSEAQNSVVSGSCYLPVWDKRKGAGFWRLLTVREGRFSPKSGEWAAWVRQIPPAEETPAEESAKHENMSSRDDLPVASRIDHGSLQYPQVQKGSEVMVIVQVSMSGYDSSTVRDACVRAASALRKAADRASPDPFPLTQMLMQIHEGVSNAAHPDSPLLDLETGRGVSGQENVIHENLCGLTFSLSASAFFQVNTCGADIMYQLVGEWASPNGRSLLLDVCCGTGTIGLSLARNVKKVVGIDVVASAIEDAKVNASLNGIDNCDWIVAKAEDALPSLFKHYSPLVVPKRMIQRGENAFILGSQVPSAEISGSDDELSIYEDGRRGRISVELSDGCSADYEYDNIVAVVDPPRAGLHKAVLLALRKQAGLHRIVYISCNPVSMASNCIELCTPQGPDGSSGGAPFKPTRVIAVDLFPHTTHCEAVMLLER